MTGTIQLTGQTELPQTGMVNQKDLDLGISGLVPAQQGIPSMSSDAFPNGSDAFSSVLIVDDHFIMRQTLKDWLTEEYPGLSVHEASSAEQALQMVNEYHPQMVLMDFHLPAINGIAATKKIKKLSPETIIIMLTIQEGENYQQQALKAGVDGYVIKRHMYDQLLTTINTYLADNQQQ
jgi:CheY-like chemotaxis protein